VAIFQFKKKKSTGGENPQGIASEGNALQKYWLRALLGILVPVLVGFATLLLLRESSVQDDQIERISQTYASQQSANVELLFDQLQNRLLVAASSPLALSAITTTNLEDVALIEKAMLDYFPGVTSLRLVPIGKMGTAELDEGSLGLRNHIELDLLRRTGEGEKTVPESYKFENVWLTSLAELIVHPRDESLRAVILATFNNEVITETLDALDGEQGRSSLQQLYRKGNFTREDEIAVAGNGSENSYQASVLLNSDQWTLVYTPSSKLLEELSINSMPVVAVLAITLLAVIAAMAYLLLQFQRHLASDIERITNAADKKTPLEIGVPELLPLARLLRSATLRGSSSLGGRGKRSITRKADDGSLSDPMFQKTSMIDEDPEESEVAEAPEKEPATLLDLGDVPRHIFRAYDIRGIAETELTEDVVTSIGKAIGTFALEKEQQALIVGCDGRTSSPKIKNQLVKALLSSGRDVIDIGVVPTPLLYFATHTLDTKSGVMVTGSHNPADYNGFKVVLDGKTLVAGEIEQIRDRIADGKYSDGAGRLVKQDVTDDYIETIIGDMAIASPLKIVIDAGNGVAGNVAPILMEELGCEVVPMYCEVDGTFPNHHPDPSVESNLDDLVAKVQEEEADLGIAFDGDGDRLAVVSAEGAIIRTDKLLMLYAQDVVSRNPGADVVFDVKCSRHLATLVSRFGGRPILWKTGHAFMKEKMQETGALLGGEFSGHIFFGERWFGFDDGMYAAARLVEIMSSSDSALEPLLADFPDTESTREIIIPVEEDEKFDIIALLTGQGDFSPGKVNTLDGVRVDYNDGFGLIRASNTVPALTARFEARDADSLERIKQQFREQLAKADAGLDPGF
jgi:phosphomannomutase / phosphoglucomutase